MSSSDHGGETVARDAHAHTAGVAGRLGGGTPRGGGDATQRPRPRLFPLLWGAPLVLWQGAFYAAPFAFMIALTFWVVKSYHLTPAFTLQSWDRVFATDFFWDAYGRSLVGAGIASVLAAVLAFPCAYLLGLRASRARLLGACLLITPFFTSYLVRVYTWRTMLGDAGVINVLLGYLGLGPFKFVDNLFGNVVGYLTLSFPLVLLLQLLALSFVDRRLIEAAYNLGCSGVRTVFAVVIPSARVGLVLSAAFAFVLSFGDFVSPKVLGGSNPPTLSLLIINEVRGGFQWPSASVIAVVMVATLLAVVSMAMVAAYRTGGGRK
jgi:spermidine/putrescine transport system permease protein